RGPSSLDRAAQRWRGGRSNHNSEVIGRLKPGVSVTQEQAAMSAIARRLEQQYPKSNAGWGVRMRTFYDWIVPEQTRRSMLVLFAAVGFLLLIACANVGNLLLTAASTREREKAVFAGVGGRALRGGVRVVMREA